MRQDPGSELPTARGRDRRRSPVAAKIAVRDGRRHGKERCLTGSGGGKVGAVQEQDVELWDIPEPGHSVVGERWVGDLTIVEGDLFEESAAESHDRAAFNLVDDCVRVDHRAALIDGRHRCHAYPTVGCDANLCTGRHRAPFSSPAAMPDPRRDPASAVALDGQPKRSAAERRTVPSRSLSSTSFLPGQRVAPEFVDPHRQWWTRRKGGQK